ncbi:hypothetical protein, partial [Salmonella enterica]|uniref:hypothetical protein n=1 Tax=Salmonella enterica TaxID=28901 RepID=UPI001CB7A586
PPPLFFFPPFFFFFSFPLFWGGCGFFLSRPVVLNCQILTPPNIFPRFFYIDASPLSQTRKTFFLKARNKKEKRENFTATKGAVSELMETLGNSFWQNVILFRLSGAET